MTSKIRILFLSANPEGTTKLKVIEEFKLIDAKIQASEYRDQFDVEQSHAVSLMELQTLFLRFKPSIVHFSGHGSETGALVFENYDGSPEEAPPNALSALFRIINEGASAGGLQENRIQCVVLSACYSLKQAKAIAKHVDCVIGISDAIKDKSATNFAASFYQALGFGRSVQSSFDLGLNQLGLADDTDQSILKLEHRKDVNPSKIFLVSANESASPTDATVVREGENEKRAKNLLYHCTQLIAESQLERDYQQLIFIDPNNDPRSDVSTPIYVYGKRVFEHLYTGHRELYDLTSEIKLTNGTYDAAYERLVKNVRRFVVDKLGIQGEPREEDPTYRNLNLQALISQMSRVISTGTWEKFRFRSTGDTGWSGPNLEGVKDGELVWEGSEYGMHPIDEDLGNRFCSVLDDLTLALKDQFIQLYRVEEKEKNDSERFNQAFKEFFVGIHTGTASLGGACKHCLSLRFHAETEITKFRAALSELHN